MTWIHLSRLALFLWWVRTMSMALIRKKFELVLISVSRSFWILQERQCFLFFVFLKKIAIICPETRASYQRGYLRTKEWITALRCTDPEAFDKAEALVAGAKGHQHAAQKASRHPSGLLGLPWAGICQYPCTSEVNLSKGQRLSAWERAGVQGLPYIPSCGLGIWEEVFAREGVDFSFLLPPKMFPLLLQAVNSLSTL